MMDSFDPRKSNFLLNPEVDYQHFHKKAGSYSKDESEEDDVIKFVSTTKSLKSKLPEATQLPVSMSGILDTIQQHTPSDNSASYDNLTATQKSTQSNELEEIICKNDYAVITIDTEDDEVIDESLDGDEEEYIPDNPDDLGELPIKKQKLNDDLNVTESDNSWYIYTRKYIVIRFKCLEDDCSVMFKKRDEFVDHMTTVHRYNPRYQCLYQRCGLMFDNNISFSNHIKVHSDCYKCAKCQSREANQQDMKRHMVDYHQEGVYKCILESCHFTGKTRIETVNHFYRKHPNRFPCEWSDCTKSFSSSYQLQIHHKGHLKRRPRTQAPRPYHCSLESCGKRFIKSAHLIEHERTHTGAKPYVCKYKSCEYAAKTKSSAMTHIRKRHLKLSDDITAAQIKNFDKQHNTLQYLEICSDLL